MENKNWFQRLFEIKFKITFTSLTGLIILITSINCDFNKPGLVAGTSLMLGRKMSLFNN